MENAAGNFSKKSDGLWIGWIEEEQKKNYSQEGKWSSIVKKKNIKSCTKSQTKSNDNIENKNNNILISVTWENIVDRSHIMPNPLWVCTSRKEQVSILRSEDKKRFIAGWGFDVR